MKLHAPSAWLFALATILAIAAILQYLSIPVAIPEIPALSVPRLAIPDFSGRASIDAFWLLFLGWLVLAIGTLLPKRAPRSQRRAPAAAT